MAELNKPIRNLIKLKGKACPPLLYENPLLDKDVADLLAESVVDLFNDNTVQPNSLAKFIKRTCKNEPDGHLCMEDNMTEVLIDLYKDLYREDKKSIDMELDIFLMRHLKEVNINSIHSPVVNQDILQALANLKGSKEDMRHTLLKDVIHWNFDNSDHSRYLGILKTMWNLDTISASQSQPDDLSIKNKSEIEELLLKCCKESIEIEILDLDEWLAEKEDLMRLLNICAISSECFQICCSILNALFISIDFNSAWQKIIDFVIQHVKAECKKLGFSLLYPNNLRHIVVLLDIEIDDLPTSVKESYIQSTLTYLHQLRKECESDLIMLLSHFPDWFNIYYYHVMQNAESRMSNHFVF